MCTAALTAKFLFELVLPDCLGLELCDIIPRVGDSCNSRDSTSALGIEPLIGRHTDSADDCRDELTQRWSLFEMLGGVLSTLTLEAL